MVRKHPPFLFFCFLLNVAAGAETNPPMAFQTKTEVRLLSGKKKKKRENNLTRDIYLGRRGTGTAAGPVQGWPHSCAAAAGRTHKPRGRWCRREVCPGEEACCPPSLLQDCVLKLSPFNLINSATKKKNSQSSTPLTCVVLTDADLRAEATKTKKRRCAKMKLRPSPCANFVPPPVPSPLLPGRRNNLKSLPNVHFLKTGMGWISAAMVNLTPFPFLHLVLWHQNNNNLSSQHHVTQLEVREAFPFCLDCHKRRIM